MASQSNETVAPPRWQVTMALFLIGTIALTFGGWRLLVLGFGRPEQLLDLGDARLKLLVEASDKKVEQARRRVQAAREDKAPAGPQKLADAEEDLRLSEESQARLTEAWDLQVGQARRGELAYVLIGAGVGAYCMWAGSRRVRARGRLSPAPVSGPA